MSDTPIPPPPEPEPESGPASSPPPPPAAIAPPASAGTTEVSDIEKNKVFAVLAYLGLLFLVPLLAAKDSPFAKYHTNQGILLFIGTMIAMAVVVVINFIPFVGWCGGCILMPVVLVTHIVFVIMGILNAVNGQMKPLPGFPKVELIK